MPFNVNNIDVTVAANGIYGITNGVLSNLLPNSLLDDPDIQVGETVFLKKLLIMPIIINIVSPLYFLHGYCTCFCWEKYNSY